MKIEDIYFSTIDSTDFIGDSGPRTLMGCVHRFNLSNSSSRIQMTYPNAVYSGEKSKRGLGRVANLFGSQEALNLFWELNKDELDQVFILNKTAKLVNSLKAVLENSPEILGKNKRFVRQRMLNIKAIAEKSMRFLKKMGVPEDRARKESMEFATKKVQGDWPVAHTMPHYSKSSGERITVSVVVYETPATEPISFDPATVDGFGLSSKNNLPTILI